MTRGRTATPDPFDLTAVSSSDELFDALSSRRLADLSAARTDDPAASLLAALVTDVDLDAPPLPAPAPARVACGGQGSCRRGVRAFVTFGVAAMVLTSAGAAAAGGNDVGALGTNHGSVRPRGSERSNENVQYQDPVRGSAFTGDRQPARRGGERRRDVAPTQPTPEAQPGPGAGATVPAIEDGPRTVPADRPQWDHWGHRRNRGRQRSSEDPRHQRPEDRPSSPKQDSPPEQASP